MPTLPPPELFTYKVLLTFREILFTTLYPETSNVAEGEAVLIPTRVAVWSTKRVVVPTERFLRTVRLFEMSMEVALLCVPVRWLADDWATDSLRTPPEVVVSGTKFEPLYPYAMETFVNAVMLASLDQMLPVTFSEPTTCSACVGADVPTPTLSALVLT